MLSSSLVNLNEYEMSNENLQSHLHDVAYTYTHCMFNKIIIMTVSRVFVKHFWGF